jgi:ribosomal protein S18 acetylase RimI-like enzyme
MTIIQNPTELNEELYKSIIRLLPQLTTRRSQPSYAEMSDLITSSSTIIFVARYPADNSPIVGMLSLVIFQVPTGIRAHIEDVVVDHKFRNRGIGHNLMQTALTTAQAAMADGVTLTSNSHRQFAIKLYENLGFKKWDTNLYYFKFNKPS